MDLFNIVKFELLSKLLIFWWDVGIYYVIGVMLIFFVVVIGL